MTFCRWVLILIKAIYPVWRLKPRENGFLLAIKIAAPFFIGTVVTVSLWGERQHIGELPDMDAQALLEFAQKALLRILISVVSIYALVAGGDYFFQWMNWQKRLKMSRQDLKDEYKQQEGSPEIKNKLRQMRRKFSRSAMMGRIPKATVIVTNPTHFAVALQFEEGMRAPICVAKGVDVLALRIRQLANDHDIPIIEDRPLARSLYRLVDVDDEIPLDLYKPVAEIIGYVMRLRMRRRRPVYER
jgi:flagellar biosynthetic protein FlhB